ncbi:MAG: RNA methyltransferase [Bacteroidetes bacterium]|nr:RNA methyltransferase [Bacteroidota bacterium]
MYGQFTELQYRKLFLDYLYGFISENKKGKFEHIIKNRTRYLTVVLEDIYQPHNASAVLRTCDCFGVQDVHIIENQNPYRINPDVTLGSDKWLTVHKYNNAEHNTEECLSSLRKKGYMIVATCPHKDDYSVYDLPLDQKTALVFGTELKGLTDIAMGYADSYVRIPMFGFTESLNISVSAALFLHHLTARLRQSNAGWQLTEDEESEIKLHWASSAVRHADLLEKEFRKNTPG